MTGKRREILHTPVKNLAPRKEFARKFSDTDVRVEPIDRVVWMAANKLDANDYNPNVVFTPELRLLGTLDPHDGLGTADPDKPGLDHH